MKTNIEEYLDTIKSIVLNDRHEQYGDPLENLKLHASLTAAYLKAKYKLDVPIDEIDMTFIMNFAKISRHATGVAKEDNFIDLGGYSAIAYHIFKTLEK